jgi:CRP-like cAMP-binding protein
MTATAQPFIGETFIVHLGLIGSLSEEDKLALLSIKGEIRDLKRGEDILKDGDRPPHSVVVISGLLQRYTLGPEGQRQIHSFYLPTDTPCLEAIHIGVMDNNLGALAPSRVGIVPIPELLRVMELHPNLNALMWRETLVQASILRAWLMRNSQTQGHERMAHLFCETAIRAKAAGLAQGNTFDLPITQQDLGDALGMSLVHVNRTLMLLRATGAVEFRGGKLTVMDWEQLVEIAQFDGSYLHLCETYHM